MQSPGAAIMRLHLADIHRLQMTNDECRVRDSEEDREKPYPWKSPQTDLAAAKKLINDCGYHRRNPELADAKQAIFGQ